MTNLEQPLNDDIQTKKKNRISNIVFYSILCLCVILAIVFRLTLYTNFIVSGNSMYPTIKPDTVVYVNKVATVRRGDVVVVYDKSINKSIIKRAVALNGDEIWVEKQSDGTFALFVKTPDGTTLTENYTHAVIDKIQQRYLGCLSSTPFTIEGIFLMGDNRNISDDSRYKGAFDTKDIIGVVIDIKGDYQ